MTGILIRTRLSCSKSQEHGEVVVSREKAEEGEERDEILNARRRASWAEEEAYACSSVSSDDSLNYSVEDDTGCSSAVEESRDMREEDRVHRERRTFAESQTFAFGHSREQSFQTSACSTEATPLIGEDIDNVFVLENVEFVRSPSEDNIETFLIGDFGSVPEVETKDTGLPTCSSLKKTKSEKGIRTSIGTLLFGVIQAVFCDHPLSEMHDIDTDDSMEVSDNGSLIASVGSSQEDYFWLCDRSSKEEQAETSRSSIDKALSTCDIPRKIEIPRPLYC